MIIDVAIRNGDRRGEKTLVNVRCFITYLSMLVAQTSVYLLVERAVDIANETNSIEQKSNISIRDAR